MDAHIRRMHSPFRFSGRLVRLNLFVQIVISGLTGILGFLAIRKCRNVAQLGEIASKSERAFPYILLTLIPYFVKL